MTCDRVLIINQGRVVAAGAPADLRREILGPSRYRLEVAGDTTALAALIGGVDPSLKLDVIGEPDAAGFRALSLATDRDSDLGESLLRALAADSRFRLRSLGRDHPTLEDVFLAATRRSWDVVDAPQSSK